MDKQKEDSEFQEFQLPIPKQKKTDLERAKLYLDLATILTTEHYFK